MGVGGASARTTAPKDGIAHCAKICTWREGLWVTSWVRHGRAGDGRVSALPASYKAPASRVCRRWRRQRRTCATTAAAARRTAPVDDSFTVARRPANSTAQQTSRAGGWSRADVQAHSSMAEAADVVLACLQRRRPLWQARDWRRRERLARPLNATTTGFGVE